MLRSIIKISLASVLGWFGLRSLTPTQPDRPAPARGGYDLAATADHREFWRVEGRAERGSGSARRELR